MATKLECVMLYGEYRGIAATAKWNRLGDGVWLLEVILMKGPHRNQIARRKTFRIHQRDAKPCWTVSMNYLASIYREPKAGKKAKRPANTPQPEFPVGAVVKFATKGTA